MAKRRRSVILAVVSAMVGLPTACSEPTRHRVLNFFFDGVPEPGAEVKRGYEPLAPNRIGATTRPRNVVVSAIVYAHAPYRDNQCGRCHDSTSGNLAKTAEEGLCQTCHVDVPGDIRWVHGPVAVRACRFCHHHHGSAYRYLLLDQPRILCLRCHNRADLSGGGHHDAFNEQECTECHSGHGGDNPYFLKSPDR